MDRLIRKAEFNSFEPEIQTSLKTLISLVF